MSENSLGSGGLNGAKQVKLTSLNFKFKIDQQKEKVCHKSINCNKARFFSPFPEQISSRRNHENSFDSEIPEEDSVLPPLPTKLLPERNTQSKDLVPN